jgi:hypothetical protein
MRITTRIKNFIFLWRENKKDTMREDFNVDNILNLIKILYKTKGCIVRNLTCSIIRKHRKEHPYRVKDYSKVKQLYDSLIPLDFSKVTVDSYVVKFSVEYPVKGNRWCEYYVDRGGDVSTYKVHSKKSSPYSYWSLEDYRGEWNHFTVLKEKTLRAFRFATEIEIENFKNRRKNYETKLKQIEEKQKEIDKLRSEL